MPIITIMQGLPASGKSTIVQEKYVPAGYQVLCRNDLRYSMGIPCGTMKLEVEPTITSILDAMLEAHINRGLNIVLDDTNVNYRRFPSLLERLLRLTHTSKHGYTICLHPLDVSPEECKHRYRKNGITFPDEVIDKMAKDYEQTKIWLDEEFLNWYKMINCFTKILLVEAKLV